MDLWHQFLLIAAAHFLALLSPGPDFFLIVRSSIVNGPRIASGVCAGIAVANGVYIGVAISGVTLLTEIAGLFLLLKWAGCAYLTWLGWQFLRAPRRTEPTTNHAATARSTAGREFRTGFISGILNPKNSLFYASLFSLGVDPHTPFAFQTACGAWMFLAVLLWDIGVARAAGHPGIVRRFMANIHRIERATGAILLALAAGIAVSR
jgi:threonine/homoserine/homoserine lactone efflux protein